MNKLKLPIFKGGYISNNKNEDLFNSNLARYTKSQSVDQLENDHDLLMSIYNNQDEGARLISKLKAFSKSKQYSLGNFPEKQMNDTIAKIFAVYVKHYRRVNLAKLELFQTDPNKVYNQLLSLYEHASCIQPVFSKIKKQGGNCDELSKQIQQRTLFLLLSVKESDLIPLSIDSQAEKKSNDQQQSADKTNAKHIVKLHKNFFEDCIRFKKTTLEKNRSNDSESLLNHSIQTFLYGNFYQSSLSRRNNDDTQFDTDEIEKCLARQYQRAIIRLMTYRFNQIFIENLNNNDKLLSIYLPYLRRNEFDWSYSKNIQLKNDISNTYYSIIKQVLSIPNLTSSIFNLLSFPYESVDLFNLSEEKIVEILFNNSISLTNPSDSLKFLSFNWFRIYVFKLCEYIEKEIILQNQSNDLLQQQELFIFNNLILNELKFFKDKFPIDFKEKEQYKNSFRELTPNLLKDSYQSIHFAFNRYLVLLLRSIHFYKHILPVCSTLDYLQEFLYIYSNNKSNITHLLIIKLLRCIIPCVQNDSEGVAKNLIEEFLSDVLNTISEENCRKEILSELIYLYRRIISVESSWQILAIEFLIKSIENKNNKQLIGSLNILGGFIESIHLGSIVQVDINDDLLFGLIIDIYENEKLYIVQYLGTNESKALPIDALKLEIDVLPPVDLDEYNERIFELLGNFLEINSSKNNLLLLEVKRRSICVLSYLLTNKKSIESFMNKSYISILVEIAKTNIYPADLLVFNKQHLEGYLLSLDRYKTIENESSFQSILMNDDDNSTNWNRTKIHPNPLVVKSLSTSYNGWKPYASEDEVTCYKQGRIGSDEISIVSFPKNISNPQAIQECGNKHKYRGRIISTTDNTYDDFPTFILDNLQLSQGKWYYCVRLPQAGLVQIGWATDGFTTSGMRGVGDDQYSWSYDGSRAVFFYDAGFYGQFDGLRWKADDIIGCGIDIDGQNTNIKYWLNGTFLGPAFTHDVNVPLSTTKCNLLPNGPNRTYYPAITLQRSTVPVELIVSPEDMQGCPLPYGYKPLLSPEVIQTENTIVEYPDHAYLIGENSEEFFMRNSSTTILRDFVNDKHMETSFTGENNDGLMVSLDNNNLSSLTISFDYQILSDDSDKAEFILAKLDSIGISWTKNNQKQRCTIIVLSKKRRIKVYIDNQCQTFDDAFQYEHLKQFHLHLLPGISAQIKSVAIWKYPLSEGQISRLFNYGLSYIANDYQQMKEYRKRVNTIAFSKNQQQFQNELLLAFNEPFTETLWEQKKNQVDEDEFKYFKSHSNEDYSTIDLFGHQTYLVLNKPNEQWSNYSIRLEISIPQWPLENENLLLITLNSQTQLYITHDKKLYLDTDYIKEECDLSISLNEYFQVFITVNNQSLLIYINNDLKIDLEMINDRFQLKSNYIDIFKQTQNSTTDDTLLISLKSLSYLNRSMTVDQLQSLSTLISPTFEVIGSSLIAMGYRKHWIDSLINQNLPIILHQQKEELTKIDFDSEQKRYLTILSKLDPSTDADIIKHLIDYSKFNTNEHIIDTAEHVYTYLISSQSTNLLQKKSEFDDNWFSQTVEGLSIPQNLNEWLQTMTSNTNDDDIYQLFDINEAMKKTSKQSIEYSHENLSSEQYYQSRLNCEQGLITIYARTIIVNIFQICSYDQSNLFPLDKFTDYSLLKSLDSIDFNQIKSILKNEFQQNQTLFLFNYLQKDIIIELIEILLKPSLINQIDVNFILNILNIFMELLKDNQNYLDLIFPTILINLIFDLFLLNPVYEIKLSIVSLFTNLLRTNDKFLLPIHIQDFFFQLLIELETNKNLSRNKLRLALIDLIYLLLRDEYELKLSEYIRNLFRLINVLDTWLDTTKHKLLPEKFLEESKRALGEEFIVNQDDFKKSNEYFNIDSDTELTNYMNESILKEISFEDFMRKLPKESQPDRIFYKDYHLLSNIPADCIHSRARLISLLNRIIVTQSPIINSTLTSEQSCLTERFRRIKLYLISPIKYLLFGKSVDKTDASYRNDYLIVKFDTDKASTDATKHESTMFYQAYQQLHVHAHTEFRRTNVQLWQALYSDMQISDPNELYRDSIRRICSDICSTRLSLFILCPNGRTNRGRNSDYWIPNVFPPNQPIPTKSYNQYRFIGQLLGMAIRTKHYLNIKFPQLLWKRLLNEDLTMEDIQAIDLQSFTIIKQSENNIEQIQSFETDQDVDSVFSRIMSDLHFTVMSSSGQIYELIPDGKNISITTKNFKQYCSLYRQYRLNEFNRQIELIQQGLYSVVPSYYISLFTPNELEDLVCGKDRIDIELLKRNTTYGKYYSETSPVIERFWKVMSDMFTDEQRKLFLNYVSGRSTLLTRDEGFQLTFRINRYPVDNNDDVDKIFPRSYRCYFTVDLPAYTTVEIMYERLQYVISSGASIDADEVMSDEPDLEQIIFDDNNVDDI